MKLAIAAAHRYPDLARLWYRSVARDVVPAFRAAGAEVSVVLFRDATPEAFPFRWFDGATLEAPSPTCRDFLEFYDATLRRDADFVLFLDADLFLLDAAWAASYVSRFGDPTLAAVSFVRRTEQPGVFALLLRAESYRALPAPALAPSWERLEAWPRAVNRQPGDRAAIALRARGLRILDVPPGEASGRIAGFHGTTVIRVTRELAGPSLGGRFDDLLVEKPYFAMGACDNLLLGALYRALFGEPFAAGPDGAHLSGSAREEVVRRALASPMPPLQFARLASYVERSRTELARLSAHQGAPLAVPRLIPRRRAWVGRVWNASRRLLRRAP